MTDPTSAARRSRMPLAVWIVAVVLPLLVTAVAVGIQLTWLPELPDPIATHWGESDSPNGFGPVWFSTALTAGIGVGLTIMFWVILAVARGPAPTATHKLLAAISLASSVLIGVLVTTTLGIQRGLADARDSVLPGWMVGAAFGVAIVAGLIGWFALPKSVHPGEEVLPSEPLELAPGERSAWIATARLADGAIVVILIAVGVATVGAIVSVIASGWLVWPLLLLPLLLLLVCSLGLAWRVRVDATGLTVRSLPLGWPRVRVAASDIASVKAVRVEPLSEFGGWGWRWSPVGGFGMVARRGDALLVVRRDGRRFTVTVDDAATAASLLAAYAASATEIGERGPQTGSSRGNG